MNGLLSRKLSTDGADGIRSLRVNYIDIYVEAKREREIHGEREKKRKVRAVEIKNACCAQVIKANKRFGKGKKANGKGLEHRCRS